MNQATKLFQFFVLLITLLGAVFFFRSNAQAVSCGGTGAHCCEGGTVWKCSGGPKDGQICSSDDFCSPDFVGQGTCVENQVSCINEFDQPCSLSPLGTSCYSSCPPGIDTLRPESCYLIQSNPTPPPTSTPAPSTCQSTWCATSAQCAAAGGTPGSGAGFCQISTDVRCCVTPGGGGWQASCWFNDQDTGYPRCNFGPGNSCNSTCSQFGQCRNCATGLVLDAQGTCNCPACVPSCTPACGQADGCGGGCLATDAAAPGAIASTTPVNGGTLNMAPAQTQVTISWSASTGAEKYDLLLYPQDNPDCSDPRAVCTFTTLGGGIVGTSYTFTPQSSAYYFYVRGVNTSCTGFGGSGVVGPWSSLVGFTITGTISGTVYEDPSGVAAISGSYCTSFGTPLNPVNPGGSSTVTVNTGAPPAAVAGNGTYTTTGPINTNVSVNFNTGDSAYICSCPVGCTYGAVPPAGNVNYYVSKAEGSWFQSYGGDIGVTGTSAYVLKDFIPKQTCTSPACEPYPLISPLGGTLEQVGTLLSSNGSWIDVNGDEVGAQNNPVGPPGADYPVKLNYTWSNLYPPMACRQNYDYFFRTYDMGVEEIPLSAPLDDFGTDVTPYNNPDTAHKPDIPPRNTYHYNGQSKEAYYRRGNLTIDQDWTLASSESMVIFVNGDLTITNGARITVPTDAFLAFIVKGNITFDATIGTASPSDTTGTIQGVYIAKGNLTVDSVGANPATAEKKFVGEGSFVACQDILLHRDFRNSPNPSVDGFNNNTIPVNLFIHRPDFMLHAPQKMKKARMNWQEIAP